MIGIDKRTIADPRTSYGPGRTETRNFIFQRITGALNVLFLLLLVWLVVRLAGAEHQEMVETIREPLVGLPLALLVLNVPLHMRIGMREVIEDYVHEPRLNRFSLMLNTFFALTIALAGFASVLKIMFWG